MDTREVIIVAGFGAAAIFFVMALVFMGLAIRAGRRAASARRKAEHAAAKLERLEWDLTE